MNVLKTSVLFCVMLFCWLISTPSFAENNVPLLEVIQKAEQGDADAQYELGIRFAEGEGVSQDYKNALILFTKAAEQRHANAQYNWLFVMFAEQGVLLPA